MASWSRRELAVPPHLSAVNPGRVRISSLGKDAVLISLADVERVLGVVNMRQMAAKRLDSSLRFKLPGERGIYLAAPGLLRILDNMKSERAQPFGSWITAQLGPLDALRAPEPRELQGDDPQTPVQDSGGDLSDSEKPPKRPHSSEDSAATLDAGWHSLKRRFEFLRQRGQLRAVEASAAIDRLMANYAPEEIMDKAAEISDWCKANDAVDIDQRISWSKLLLR